MSSGAERYVVTGGSGFLGSNLVRALAERGDRVLVLDNNFRGSVERLEPVADRIDFEEIDIRDYNAVRRNIRTGDVVVHLAFINGTRHFYEMPQTVLEVGVKGTLNVLEASVDAGVREFVFASSSEVYQTPPEVPTDETVPMTIPDPLNPRYSYGGGKLIGELLTFNYGRDNFERTVVFRPHNVYGPDMGFEHVIPEFVVRLRRQIGATETAASDSLRFEIQGTGEETRAFCEVRDFTDGLLLVLDRGRDQNVYNIGNDEEVEIRDLARMVAATMGREVEIVPTPLRAGGTPRRCPDIEKLRALGYEPKLDLRNGLDDTVAWYDAWARSHPETAAD